ncbi:DUF3225 domain-containing protein [Methylovirgula ligni]|uniref:Uncharacterized protein DUF3225 n=1 Tax=Methylovirgula ligni TaxID=569860 RepID=A0A3D9Z1W6_9HYPH|nr:oxalurate catabolism protein HpxZ [Methylovirgula ligni]QAY95534.1 DUF3225 domain-containing protein [Methylovirgula ligni]REF89127.1 uncharacterized protein DUF3225 [Methylovirgula ligni]
MEINRPDVVAEVTKKFLEYEQAINDNDIEILDAAFLESTYTVRFGMTEELWSHEEIKAFRRSRNTAGLQRNLERYEITTYGDNIAVANAIFSRENVNKIGRQSQTWIKFGDGWRVVSAHVSLVDKR